MKLAIVMLLAYTPFFVWMIKEAKEEIRKYKENMR